MHVRVLYFGVLRDLQGRGETSLELAEGATVAELLEQLRGQAAHPVWAALAVAVNREYATAAVALHEGDEVALLPPVSGGADAPAATSPQVALTRERIDSAGLVAALTRGSDGAVVIFEGVVRDNTRGRRTLYLDYEAYEGMALAEMEKLARAAAASHAIDGVGVVHRLGRLEIGESSIVIVVTAAHRGPAFAACRWLIDTLKRTVPVWKREHFVDGAVWTDGEPFPAELTAGR
jgi:MoaE-MoaD fusion protein